MRRLFAASLVALGLVGCGGAHYVSTRSPDTVLLASPRSPAEVRAAIVRALADKRYATESEQAGPILARLDKGSEHVRVAVEYTRQQYAVRYVDSAGMKTETDPQGNLLVESSYRTWTDRLSGTKYLCPGEDAFRQCVSSGPAKCSPAGRC